MRRAATNQPRNEQNDASPASLRPGLGLRFGLWLLQLVMLLLRQPGRALGTLVTVFASALIITNALGEKQGAHPAPLFDSRSPDIPLHSIEKSEDRVGSPAVDALRQRTAQQAPSGQAPIQMRASMAASTLDTVTVVTIQSLLSALKFYHGPVDGLMGRQTEAAIRDFESSEGLPLTGAPSEAMMAVLRDRAQEAAMPRLSAAASTHNLQGNAAAEGSASRSAEPGGKPLTAQQNQTPIPLRKPRADGDVRNLQQALVDTGYGPINVDGVMGAQTSAAIRQFQQDKGLAVTGQLSDRLLAELVMSNNR